MLELKLGFVSSEELAEWSQRTSHYITNNKKKWCENFLSHYAEYELVRGGVIITKIIESVFNGPAKQQVANLFDSCWGTPTLKVDRCKYASEKIYKKLTGTKPKEKTVYSYTCLEKRKRYGVPKKRPGTHGESHWVFCKIVDKHYELFTPKEEAIKKELMKKYLASREDQVLEMRAAKADYEREEITKEEYQQIVDNILATDTGWDEFIQNFEKAIGYRTDFATLLEERAWTVQEGNFDF